MRPVRTRFRFGSLPSLTSPPASNSLAHSTKGTPSQREAAPTARGRTVSGTVSLPSRGAFHLSLTVLVRYRSQESIQAWMVVHPDSDRVPRARPYSGTRSAARVGCAYGAVTLCRRPSQAVRLPLARRPGGRRPPDVAVPQPQGREALRPLGAPWFGHGPLSLAATRGISVDFSSSGYLDVSVPRVVLPPPMGSAGGCRRSRRRVLPFGNPRIEGRVRLPGDYRGLPRPSSASCAKASAVRP